MSKREGTATRWLLPAGSCHLAPLSSHPSSLYSHLSPLTSRVTRHASRVSHLVSCSVPTVCNFLAGCPLGVNRKMEDIDSSDIEFDAPPRNPFHSAGKASVMAMLDHALDDRIASKRQVKRVIYVCSCDAGVASCAVMPSVEGISGYRT